MPEQEHDRLAGLTGVLRSAEGPPEVVVLCDGGLESLVALASAVEHATAGPSRVLATPAVIAASATSPTTLGGRVTAAGVECVRQQARVLGARCEILPGLEPSRDAAESASLSLVRAVEAAAQHGAAKVVWPIVVGPTDAGALARVLNLSLMAGRLVSVDRGVEIVADTPLADLEDWQIADIAVDLSVPAERVWWWGDASGRAERGRWLPQLERMGWTGARPMAAR